MKFLRRNMMSIKKIAFFIPSFILYSTISAFSQSGNVKSTANTDSLDYSLTVSARKTLNSSKPNSSFGPPVNYRTRNIAQLTNYKPVHIETDLYGGRLDRQGSKTGFYHVQKIKGRWWVVDPEGNLFLHNAVSSVTPGGSEQNKAALKSKFGNTETWAAKTLELLTDNGFNGAAAWSDITAIRSANKNAAHPLAYNIIINFMSGYGQQRGGTHRLPGHQGYLNNVIFVFDPGFATYCEERARELTNYKDDKNLMGYFSDNEMPLARTNLAGYLALPHTEPGYQAAKRWLEENHADSAKLTDANKKDFLKYVCDTYFKTVSAAIKKYDPNHMYIGCRFYATQRFFPEVIKSAGNYVDVISINYYNYWTPKLEDMQNWEKWSGRPFMATEWYVKGEDAGLANTSGAGFLVKTQADRGLFYQNFVLGLIESKTCVGWHWFKYQDNDPQQKGAEPSNIDANKGIFNVNYEPYKPLLDKMSELNKQMYSLADYFDRRK
jgi:hypothetical protein